ncbi:hypothetical protein BX600DRAFT_475297 [Xylariales sp. PMI_506]|nr:hypothetical protein BX600DRAFT_475297 [Xylariales sp. PMI_506]
MRCQLAILTAAGAAVARAQLSTPSTTASTVGVTEYLSEIYGTTIPSGVTGAVATTLAMAFASLETQLITDSAFNSAADVIYSVALTATDSAAAMSEITAAAILNAGLFTTADWYISGVPDDAKSEIALAVSEFEAIQTSVLDAATSTSAPTSTTTTTKKTTTTSAASTGSGSSSSAATSSSSTAGAAAKVTGAAVAGLAAIVAVGAAAL